MAFEQSYKITLNNNLTEKEGIDFVMREDRNLCNPSKESRAQLLEIFNLPKSFSRAFDLIKVPQKNDDKNTLKYNF